MSSRFAVGTKRGFRSISGALGGLVLFKHKRRMYYGTADSFMGVANAAAGSAQQKRGTNYFGAGPVGGADAGPFEAPALAGGKSKKLKLARSFVECVPLSLEVVANS